MLGLDSSSEVGAASLSAQEEGDGGAEDECSGESHAAMAARGAFAPEHRTTRPQLYRMNMNPREGCIMGRQSRSVRVCVCVRGVRWAELSSDGLCWADAGLRLAVLKDCAGLGWSIWMDGLELDA